MSDDVLLSARDGGVLTLTLNRPAQRNALSMALMAEIIDALSSQQYLAAQILVQRPYLGAGGGRAVVSEDPS